MLIRLILYFVSSSSERTLRLVFVALGNAVRKSIFDKLRKSDSIGLMINEVCDIAVFEQMVSFAVFVDPELGKLVTKFISVDNVLEKFSAPNAEAISTTVLEIFSKEGVPFGKISGLSTDGAAVMVGKDAGVGAQKKLTQPYSLFTVSAIALPLLAMIQIPHSNTLQQLKTH